MATLLHDAVMNPAEGNVSWPQGMAAGDVKGAGKKGVGGRGHKLGLGDSWLPGRIDSPRRILYHVIKGPEKGHEHLSFRYSCSLKWSYSECNPGTSSHQHLLGA